MTVPPLLLLVVFEGRDGGETPLKVIGGKRTKIGGPLSIALLPPAR